MQHDDPISLIPPSLSSPQLPTHPPTAAAAAVASSWWWGMAWLVWNGVVVDGFEGGRLSVPSSLLRFYPARCAGIPPCCSCVCFRCERGRARRPCPAKIPPIKVCLTSPPSPSEKEATAQATPKRRWYSDKSEKRASLLQEDHLNWPNNQITIKPLLTL